MPDSVTQWLEQLGLGQYAEAFEENAVELTHLPNLDHEILQAIGVKAAGHRMTILEAAAALKDGSDQVLKAEGTLPTPVPGVSGEAERRQLTVMFCDLVGSTELSQKLDPEDLREVNRAYQDSCKAAIERYDGYVARYMGDGVLAYFGYPRAHEDDAERAIRAGLRLVVESIAELNEVGDKQDVELGVRVGIATGPVVVGDLIGEGASQESAVVGETPNLAARLQALAAPNAVVIGPGTHELAGGRFEYDDLGPQELKGIAEPVRAWRVFAPTSAESRFEAAHRAGLTPLVGREHEIGLLLDRWGQAKEGDGQVVLLSGEAGIGKSRITETLRERAAGDDPVRLRYQCSPYHTNSALHPMIEQLERAAQLDSEDTNEAKLDKLESLLAKGASDVAAVAPLFAPLLSIPSGGRYAPLEMTPERQKEQTLEALVAQMEGLSRHHPVLLIFEDVHWVDPTSLEWLELTVGRAQTVPVLVVITFRPEFPPPWAGHTHVTTLTLNRFTRSLAAEMVEKVTAGKPLPDEVLEKIIEKTDGVPLFVEELTKTTLESGLLTEEPEKYVFSGLFSEVAIPATLHDSLMARLDRLGAVKEVAQTASAIGREFDYDLLAAVSPLSFTELRNALGQLIDAELVFRRGRSQEGGYIFKHALVQDAAYESLLRSRRQELHSRIAAVVERRFPETTEAQPELLARHYTEAGQLEKAIFYWQRAAERANERSAHEEAVNHARKGLSLLGGVRDDETRMRDESGLQMSLGNALLVLTGYGGRAGHDAHQRALELGQRLGDDDLTFPAMRIGYHQMHGEYDKADVIARQALELAERSDDRTVRIAALHMIGNHLCLLGKPRDAIEHLEKLDDLYSIDGPPIPVSLFGQEEGLCGRTFLAMVLWMLGYPDRARKIVERTLQKARKLNHAQTTTFVMFWGCAIFCDRGDGPAYRRAAEECVAFCAEQRIFLWGLLARFYRGHALTVVEGDERGIDEMHRVLDEWKERGVCWAPTFLTLLAEVYAERGRYKEGLEVCHQALELLERTGERRAEAATHCAKGVLLLGQPGRNGEAAKDSFNRALEVSRNQGAKSFELRAAANLARLWRDQGKTKEARDLLAPVYDWFTEGFQTADLKEARALLEQLS